MSKYVIGIDVGGSTTKIVGFDENKNLINPLFVRATDQITSIYGAFGKFTSENSIELDQISRVMMTGVGSTFITKPIYGLKCESVPEFECVGRGGLYLSGLEDAIVVSLGTGTALVHAKEGNKIEYLGGTGVGGGTLMGLSKQLLKMDEIEHIVELAKEGDLNNIDLRIKDISKLESFGGLPEIMTAANFGKISDIATKSDVAIGIINMVFEVAGMLAIFAARNHNLKDIVLTGNLTRIPQSVEIFENLNSMFGVNFIIPKNSQFSTVIGAALSAE
ncbi:MAG: type II pantothenate kinase [Ruminococcaceae bacterium]|nr:type II pantothenate kinase [Oscillospiraceae bacterium]